MPVICRSIHRLLRKKLVRLPAISPAPDSAQPNNEFRKVLSAAQKLKKDSGDAYLGVDTLLRAVVETSKDMQEVLNEAGNNQNPDQIFLTDFPNMDDWPGLVTYVGLEDVSELFVSEWKFKQLAYGSSASAGLYILWCQT